MMTRNIIIPFVVTLLSLTVALFAQSTTPRDRRCFQFTWLGPKWNNESVFLNATCQDATRLSRGVPCVQPLVVSYDGSWPDVDYIWTHHRQHATCILADNDVCAKYTYYFNGIVENSTFMCTRAIDTHGNAFTHGCYQSTNGSFVTRVCLCQSIQGGMPCNSATTFFNSFSMFLILTIFILLNNNNKMHL